MKIFIKNQRSGIDAAGIYNPVTKECIVLKGSKVSDFISNAPTFHGAKSIKELRAGTVENGVVIKDMSFKSCSTAGNYVTGRSTDGFSAWRVEEGKTLREYLNSDS